MRLDVHSSVVGFWITHTLKSVVMMSAKPSADLGSRYLEAKPLNAMCGRIVRDSRFVCGD